jgi:hypothetical protein
LFGLENGQSRRLHQLGAAQPQEVLLLLALGLGDHDDGAIAAGARHDRKSDPGIARGRLDHQATRLQRAALLGLQDHPFAGAILHRLARIHEFGLAENGAAGQFGCALQFDQRRVADRLDDVFVECHVGGNLLPVRVLPWPETSVPMAKGEAFCSAANFVWRAVPGW